MIDVNCRKGITKIADNNCDENTIKKIKKLLKKLGLKEKECFDWEVQLYDEQMEGIIQRHITSPVSLEDGTERPMTWEEAIDGGINGDFDLIMLRMLFLMDGASYD